MAHHSSSTRAEPPLGTRAQNIKLWRTDSNLNTHNCSWHSWVNSILTKIHNLYNRNLERSQIFVYFTFVFMNVYVHIYVYICVHIYIHTHIHKNKCAYMFIHVGIYRYCRILYTCTQACTCAYMHTWTYTHICTHTRLHHVFSWL